MLAANWKMNLTFQEATELFSNFNQAISNNATTRYVVFAPTIFLPELSKLNSFIHLGAQNFYPAEKGAFTGEISLLQLKEFHVSHILIGHSERRGLFLNRMNSFNKKLILHSLKIWKLYFVAENHLKREIQIFIWILFLPN